MVGAAAHTFSLRTIAEEHIEGTMSTAVLENLIIDRDLADRVGPDRPSASGSRVFAAAAADRQPARRRHLAGGSRDGWRFASIELVEPRFP
jgi:hypothetical protein